MNGQKILLTGATGFLGAHLLDDLLKSTTAEVYCLVRGQSASAAIKRLAKILYFYFGEQYLPLLERRIFVITGDLAESQFGLAPGDYARLGQEIGLIIHAAALVNNFGTTADLERINVAGTEEIMRFAQANRIHLAYISTTSIMKRTITGASQAIFTEKDFELGEEYKWNTYIRSKFAAEKRIREAQAGGLLTTIFRVGGLTGRYSDGQFQINIEKNGFYNRLKFVLTSGYLPEALLDVTLEYTPVDLCSQAIVKILGSAGAVNRVFHLYNPNYIKIRDLLEYVREMGIAFKVLPGMSFQDYAETIKKSSKQPEAKIGFFFFLRNFTQDTDAEQELVTVSSTWTRDYLRNLGFLWPAIDKGYILKTIDYMRISGFLS